MCDISGRQLLSRHEGGCGNEGIGRLKAVGNGMPFEERAGAMGYLLGDLYYPRNILADEPLKVPNLPGGGTPMKQLEVHHRRKTATVKRSASDEGARPLVPSEVPYKDIRIERHRT